MKLYFSRYSLLFLIFYACTPLKEKTDTSSLCPSDYSRYGVTDLVHAIVRDTGAYSAFKEDDWDLFWSKKETLIAARLIFHEDEKTTIHNLVGSNDLLFFFHNYCSAFIAEKPGKEYGNMYAGSLVVGDKFHKTTYFCDYYKVFAPRKWLVIEVYYQAERTHLTDTTLTPLLFFRPRVDSYYFLSQKKLSKKL